MDNKPLVSVIIPVYNVAQYLPKCIDSILDQNYNNIEVLLINDGSTDNSGNICDEYSYKDNRIRVFHQENLGVSSARNKGIKNANGYWICFVDADDWIEKNSLMNIIISLNGNADLDMIIAKSYLYSGERFLKEKYPFKKEWISKCSEGIKLYVENEYMRGSVWGVLFQKEFLHKHDIYFPLNIGNGEDSIFIILCNIYAECVYFVDVHFYNVFERAGSASRNWTFDRVLNMVNNLTYINHYLNSNDDLSTDAKSLLNHGKLRVLLSIYSNFYSSFTFNKYFKLRNPLKNELKEKISIGDIRSGRYYVKLLNISLDLYALLIFGVTFLKKIK